MLPFLKELKEDWAPLPSDVTGKTGGISLTLGEVLEGSRRGAVEKELSKTWWMSKSWPSGGR